MLRLIACALTVSMAVATVAPAADPAASGAQSAAAPGESVRCKRYTETGSLAKVRKECHTQAEWQRMAMQARQDARDMINNRVNSQQNPQ